MDPEMAIASVPTWHGQIEITRDALLIFEACLLGALRSCLRRLVSLCMKKRLLVYRGRQTVSLEVRVER